MYVLNASTTIAVRDIRLLALSSIKSTGGLIHCLVIVRPSADGTYISEPDMFPVGRQFGSVNGGAG